MKAIDNEVNQQVCWNKDASKGRDKIFLILFEIFKIIFYSFFLIFNF